MGAACVSRQSFSQVGFLLCDCGPAGDPGAAAAAELLQEACPGAELRVVARACRDRESFVEALAALEGRTVVVGACADEELVDVLRQGVGWRGPGSLNVIFADVRGPAGGRVPEGGRLLARMRGLGWRALAHPGVGPDNIAIRVRRPRRYDEDGPLAIARPAYGVVPPIDRLRCQAYQGCRFCLGVCPEEALVPLGENVELLSYRCQGCGGCVAACRFGAVEYPMWSDAEPLAEVAGLMAGPEAPGVVVLACPYALNALPERVAWPDGVEAVALPCLARLDPALVLYAALLGAGVAVLGCPGTCGRRLCAAGPRRAAVFARRALEAGGWPVTVIWIEPEELVERGWSPFPPLAAARADSEGERPAGAGPVVQPAPGVPRLADLVARCLESRAGLRLEGGDVPFGWVEAHGARCNGCGACVRRCPTAALRFREEAGTVELRFGLTPVLWTV